MDKKLFALLSGCLLSGIAEAGQTKPNVIIIYTDDHGTLDANCFGAKNKKLPINEGKTINSPIPNPNETTVVKIASF